MNKPPQVGSKVWCVGYGYDHGKFDYTIVQDIVDNVNGSSIKLRNQNRPYTASEVFETRQRCRDWYAHCGVTRNRKNLVRGDKVWFFHHKKWHTYTPQMKDLYIDCGIVASTSHCWVRIEGLNNSRLIADVYKTRRECEKALKVAKNTLDYRIIKK